MKEEEISPSSSQGNTISHTEESLGAAQLFSKATTRVKGVCSVPSNEGSMHTCGIYQHFFAGERIQTKWNFPLGKKKDNLNGRKGAWGLKPHHYLNLKAT